MFILLSPIAWLVMSGLAWRALHRAAWPLRAVPAIVGLLALIAMTPFGANAQVWSLEHAVPPAPAACGTSPWSRIVVLSGGFDRPPRDDSDVSALTLDSIRRLMHAIDLQRAHPGAALWLVGGGRTGTLAESRVMATMARRWGVPADGIVTEERSDSTWENARNVAALGRPPAEPVHVVTSGIHMARAVQAFSAAGMAVCPHAADSRFVPYGSITYFWPQTSAIAKTEDVWHEWLGRLDYAWRARRQHGAATPPA